MATLSVKAFGAGSLHRAALLSRILVESSALSNAKRDKPPKRAIPDVSRSAKVDRQ
jgi:hypothetical protein